jgi:hypothetical protein
LSTCIDTQVKIEATVILHDNHLATAMVFPLWDWRHHCTSKTMSRRNWTNTTVKKWLNVIARGGTCAVGRSFKGVDHIFGSIRILRLYKQKLEEMLVSDVVKEGGKQGQSVVEFIDVVSRKYPKTFVHLKRENTKTINWQFEYTVIEWEWVK